jgi:hypothetical protein
VSASGFSGTERAARNAPWTRDVVTRLSLRATVGQGIWLARWAARVLSHRWNSPLAGHVATAYNNPWTDLSPYHAISTVGLERLTDQVEKTEYNAVAKAAGASQ